MTDEGDVEAGEPQDAAADNLQASTPARAAAASPSLQQQDSAVAQPSLAAETPAVPRRSSLEAATPARDDDGAPASSNAAATPAGLSEQLEQLQLQPSQQELQQQHLASLLALQATTPGPLHAAEASSDAAAAADQAVPQQPAAAVQQPAAAAQRPARAAKDRQQQRAAATAAAADAAADEAEVQRQAQEQQRLAEAHFEAWAAQQATTAAQQQLQQLELAASAAQALTPLQQMLQACGQPVRFDTGGGGRGWRCGAAAGS